MSYDVADENPQIREGTLAERQLAGWCRDAAASTVASFRLLVCSPRVGDRNIWPLPLSSGTLREVLAALRVPSLFPRAPAPQLFISALGTTRAIAGSVEAQRAIDLDLNLSLARAAHDAGVDTYVLISSASARVTGLESVLESISARSFSLREGFLRR